MYLLERIRKCITEKKNGRNKKLFSDRFEAKGSLRECTGHSAQ
jgi:hypothetical protein